MYRVRFLVFSILAAALLAVLASADPSCAPPATGTWWINDTSVLCDNGTEIIVNGQISINNGSLNVTNGTRLNATQLILNDEDCSLFMNGSSRFNSSVIVYNGTVTLNHTMISDLTLFGEESFVTAVDTNITGDVQIGHNLSLVSGARLTFENVTITSSSFYARGGANLSITNSEINTATFLVFNSSGKPAPIVTLTETDLVASNLQAYGQGKLEVSGGIINATAIDCYEKANITHVGRLVATNLSLYENCRFTTTSSNLTLGGNFTIEDTANVTMDNSTLLFNSSSIGLVLDDNAWLNITNSSFSDIEMALFNGTFHFTDSYYSNQTIWIHAFNQSVLTVTNVTSNTSDPGLLKGLYFFLYNESSTTIADSVFKEVAEFGSSYNTQDLAISNSLFELLWLSSNNSHTFTNITVTRTMTLLGSSTNTFSGENNLSVSTLNFGNPSNTQRSNGVFEGNISFASPTLTFLSGSNLTRVYPLYLLNESGQPLQNANVTILASLGDPETFSWTELSDANGYLEPNITFDSSTYDETFYLYLPDNAGQYRELTLLEDTPINWSGIQMSSPYYTRFEATATDIATGSFGFNITVSNDTIQLNYTITNGSHVWSNRSWNESELNSSEHNLSLSFNGLLLPAGNWTLWINFTNGSNLRSVARNLTSDYAIVNGLTSSASGSTYIGGSNLAFTFNVTVKSAGSIVSAYLNLTTGSATYNANRARLSNGTDNVTIGRPGYAGAGNLTLPGLNETPSYIEMNLSNDIFTDELTMVIVPYSSLVAGTYRGTYGFGVFG